jgi:hypothetical protein
MSGLSSEGWKQGIEFHGALWLWLSVPEAVTDSLVAEPEGSTPLIPEPATGHDPEPVPSTSHLHSLGECSRCSDWLQAGRPKGPSSSLGRLMAIHFPMSSRGSSPHPI